MKEINELNVNARGGTELMVDELHRHVSADLLDKVQIIPSRVREIDNTRHRILWLHDLPDDPESKAALANEGWSRFHRIVFVSHWQMQQYINTYRIPYSKCVVMLNAIEPISVHEKPTDKIGLIYFSTPHRGLELLTPVFDKLVETHDDIELNVYSSFKLYGWEERDKNYEGLYDHLRNNPKVNYHGSVSNEEIRLALTQNHILAYPCIWPETSCRVLMESMSAGLMCVHPAYAALPETAANWTLMYPWHEEKNVHANVFYVNLNDAINLTRKKSISANLRSQQTYADLFYSWDLRKMQWESLLRSVLAEPLEQKSYFVYKS